jgi:hypothetical protein
MEAADRVAPVGLSGSLDKPPRMPRWLGLGGAVAFMLLATANGAGYRYGTSDQAFYIPVVVHALDKAAFPRDGSLIDAQGRLMILDEIIAGVVGSTGVSLESLFLAGYLISVALIWIGLVLIGTHVYRSPWAVAALGAAFTLRHRIPQTSANSFEPYFHPRMLAFGIGLMAIVALLRRRSWIAVALIALAAVVHITTAMWFGVLVGVALTVLDARMRRLAQVTSVGAVSLGGMALATGRLHAALAPMDSLWLQAVASKDSLFATEWPMWAWIANLALLAVVWAAHVWRERRGFARAEDGALAWGATALVCVFLLTLPLVAAEATLPVQLQISRVFWLVDFLALVYLLAVVLESGTVTVRAVAVVLMAVSVLRGGYVMLVERPERALFAVGSPDSPWEDAMRWVARQPLGVHVLADPGHAWKYGTSVRVAAGRDVFHEEVKDSALAIYSPDVAARVVERTEAIGDFGALTAEHARSLAKRYGLDYLVIEADLPLPLLYRNNRFRIYALRDRAGT